MVGEGVGEGVTGSKRGSPAPSIDQIDRPTAMDRLARPRHVTPSLRGCAVPCRAGRVRPAGRWGASHDVALALPSLPPSIDPRASIHRQPTRPVRVPAPFPHPASGTHTRSVGQIGQKEGRGTPRPPTTAPQAGRQAKPGNFSPPSRPTHPHPRPASPSPESEPASVGRPLAPTKKQRAHTKKASATPRIKRPKTPLPRKVREGKRTGAAQQTPAFPHNKTAMKSGGVFCFRSAFFALAWVSAFRAGVWFFSSRPNG